MYCDGVLGQNYFSHVADEVPEYLHLMMGLSRRREDNYIAGISMGGMGAAKVALTYPERFKAVALFSGLLDIKQLMPIIEDWHRIEFPFLFDEEANIDTTQLNPINLLDASKHADLDILVRCGKQDELFGMSKAFFEKAKTLGLRVRGIFEDGGHEWRLWDRYLDDFIAEIGK
jgi:S-formylglutathione hydrolase FrmB